MLTATILVQAIYYLLTGLWPLFSIDTFQKVTGPKTDLWLVKMIGALFAVVGLALLTAAWRSEINLSIVVLGMASAIAVIIVDVVYVMKRIIRWVYLLDAVVEFILLMGWGVGIVSVPELA